MRIRHWRGLESRDNKSDNLPELASQIRVAVRGDIRTKVLHCCRRGKLDVKE